MNSHVIVLIIHRLSGAGAFQLFWQLSSIFHFCNQKSKREIKTPFGWRWKTARHFSSIFCFLSQHQNEVIRAENFPNGSKKKKTCIKWFQDSSSIISYWNQRNWIVNRSRRRKKASFENLASRTVEMPQNAPSDITRSNIFHLGKVLTLRCS